MDPLRGCRCTTMDVCVATAVTLCIVALLSLALGTLVVLRHRSTARFRYLAQLIPGPKPLPIIGNVLDVGISPRELLVSGKRLCREYGDLLRAWIGPLLVVFINSPDDLEVLLGSMRYINKGMLYTFLYPWMGTGLLTGAGEKWHRNRKIITPTFHFKMLEQFLPVMERNMDVLLHKLQAEQHGKPFNIYQYITNYALDVICESAMGVSVGAQDNTHSGYPLAVKTMGDIIMSRMLRPWLHPDWAMNMSSLGRTQRKALKVLHSLTKQVIKQRKEEMASKQVGVKDLEEEEQTYYGRRRNLAFLDLLLESARDGAELSDSDIQEEVDTFMFEGHDTTTVSICYTLHLLSRDQHVQEQVYNEVKELCGGGEGGKIKLTMQNLGDMKYLERVIKESLRLYPSVPLISRQLTEEVQVKTGNYILPEGTVLVLSPYLVQRDPNLYPDPERFDPDRFLPENVLGRHPYSYIPFSAGPRNCIGQKFAMMEMKSTIANIVWHYRLLDVPDYTPDILPELTLKSSNGIMLGIERRECNVAAN